jgi:hypothetical protein
MTEFAFRRVLRWLHSHHTIRENPRRRQPNFDNRWVGLDSPVTSRGWKGLLFGRVGRFYNVVDLVNRLEIEPLDI